MNIRSITRILLVAVVIGCAGLISYHWYTPTAQTTNQPCAFCDQHILDAQTFYEDSLVRGMCTHKPMLPFHCLIVIKRHISQFEQATEDEIIAAYKLIKKINMVVQRLNGPSSYLLLQKNGCEAGQTVPHVHIHYMPTKQTNSQNAPTFGLLWPFIRSPFQRPISKDVLIADVAVMKKELLTLGTI